MCEERCELTKEVHDEVQEHDNIMERFLRKIHEILGGGGFVRLKIKRLGVT